MAWPVDRARATLNTNRHDAYSHDCVSEVGIKNARQFPHSGRDFGGEGPIRSVAGGEIVEAGYDREAGWYAIEWTPYGVWFVYFHAVAAMLPAGTPTTPGKQIGTIGASGTGAAGAHLHLSAATSLDAARRLISIGVYKRNGRSSAKWAADHGLTDPLPLIAPDDPKPSPTPAPAPAPIPEDDMSKTKIYRRQSNGYCVVANPSTGFLWHIPSPGYVAYVRALDVLDDPNSEIVNLADDAFRMLCGMTQQAHDATARGLVTVAAYK